MNLIWTYLKKYPKWLALDMLGAILFVVVNLGLPTFLARMIDQGITKNDASQLYFWAGMMGFIVLLGIAGRVILTYAAGKLTTTIVKDIRNDMYEKIQDYSHHEYEQIGVSSLVARMTNDAFVLMQFSEMVLKLGIITPLMMVASVVMTLVTSPSLAWTVAVAIPFLIFVIYYVATKTRPLSEKQQKRLDTINQYVRENLMGLRVIRAFTREEFQEERFSDVNEQYTETSKKLLNLTGLTEPVFVHINIAMIVAIIW
ncbi:MAG: ABC transporter permease, partial [Streptococcus suis]